MKSVGNNAALSPATPLEKEIEGHNFVAQRGDDVIGRLAYVTLKKGDTLPDIARHFNLGLNAVSAANPGTDAWVPEVGRRLLLPLSYILPDAPKKGIVVNLATMRLFRFKDDRDGRSMMVSTYPIGIGTKEKPTPTGQMRVVRKATLPTWHVPPSIAEAHKKKGDPLPAQVPPGPENPLGEFALYLSKSGYLIHGTNKPASIGLNASNGCMRLYPEDVKALYQDTPVNTPVVVVNQPYLVGQREGVLYFEAHTPLDGSGATELERAYAKLRRIEKTTPRKVDWKKVKEVQVEAKGFPVPVSGVNSGGGNDAAPAVEVEHPERLYGSTELPELKVDAWYVLAADVPDEVEARRVAAIINHQGPPIPARVLSKSARRNSYKVIAGPFSNGAEAKEVVRRLKIDLELDGVVVPGKEG